MRGVRTIGEAFWAPLEEKGLIGVFATVESP